jgi:hypothetical protein
MNPYKKMYLVSEDEYMMTILGKQQQNIDEKVEQQCSTIQEAETTLQKQNAAFHDEKYLHKAPLDNADDDKQTNIKWENVPLETYTWDALPSSVRTKARLLITLVKQHAIITEQQEFQQSCNIRPVSGSNIFDIIQYAVNTKRTVKSSKNVPKGWNEFLTFLSINKVIPRSILSAQTLKEIAQLDNSKIKKSKLTVLRSPFFETLFPNKNTQ